MNIAPNPDPAQKFIADIYPAAMRVSKETGMSMKLIIAQAALETGWGKKVLPETNNIFNIKAFGGWDGPSKTFNVWEIENGHKVWKDQPFRVYESTDEALRDRFEFLHQNPRYRRAGLFDEGTKGDFVKEARALQRAGYATDPAYAEKLEIIYNGRNMQAAISAIQSHRATGSLGLEREPVQSNPGTRGNLEQAANKSETLNVQKLLNKLGYCDSNGHSLVADGDFGQKTKEAVRAFQRAHNLEDDGIVGDKTLAAFKKADSTPMLSNTDHPSYSLYQQALAGIDRLPGNSFHNEEERKNAAACLAFEAKVSGMSKIDHVVLSKNGEGLFAVQGDIASPGHSRIHVDKNQAQSEPLEKSTFQLQQEMPAAQAQQLPSKESPVMRIA